MLSTGSFDPYRSLAGALRRHVKAKTIDTQFAGALAEALARTKAADYLSGWCGPSE